MSFSQFIHNLVNIISNVVNWLLITFDSLYDNYIFKIFIFLTLFLTIYNFVCKIFNITTNNTINIENTDDIDTSFWGDDE